MRFISRLDNLEDLDKKYNFKSRARALVEKWSIALPKGADDTPGPSIPPSHRGEQKSNFLATLDPALRPTALPEQKTQLFSRHPVQHQQGVNELRMQVSQLLTCKDPIDTSAARSSQVPHASGYDGASDLGESEDETEYEHTIISVTGQSYVASCTSSTESNAPGTIFTNSGDSTQRGAHRDTHNGAHDGSSGSSSATSDTSTWQSPGSDSQMAVIARKKLAALSFTGDIDGRRFMREFEKLVDRVQPEMSDDDKRILLVRTNWVSLASTIS